MFERGLSLNRSPTETVAKRARWLAELAGAIDQAQMLAFRLGVAEGESAEAKDLHARLEAARMEVESLRLGGFGAARQQTDCEWMNLPLWSDSRLDPAA